MIDETGGPDRSDAALGSVDDPSSRDQGGDDPVMLESRLLEEAAAVRAITGRRIGPRFLLLENDGQSYLFFGFAGPETTRGGVAACVNRLALRELLRRADVPVPIAVVHSPSDAGSAGRRARQLDAPFRVRPARVAGTGSVTRGVSNERDLDEAIRRARRASTRRQRPRARVLIEEDQAGHDLWLIVVADRLVAALELDPPPAVDTNATPGSRGGTHDVSELLHSGFTKLATRAIAAIPGITIGVVRMTAASLGDPPRKASARVDDIDPGPPLLTHQVASGHGRDVAGAILDHYVSRPRPSRPGLPARVRRLARL